MFSRLIWTLFALSLSHAKHERERERDGESHKNQIPLIFFIIVERWAAPIETFFLCTNTTLHARQSHNLTENILSLLNSSRRQNKCTLSESLLECYMLVSSLSLCVSFFLQCPSCVRKIKFVCSTRDISLYYKFYNMKCTARWFGRRCCCCQWNEFWRFMCILHFVFFFFGNNA